MELPQITHDGPMAGQSLTAEVNSRPWQNPPQFSTVDEAIERCSCINNTCSYRDDGIDCRRSRH